MPIIAHIGNVPVEEWLPFLVPVVALYIYGRRKDRHRREEVRRVLDAGEPLDDSTVSALLAQWSASDHREVSREHLPLLYPPGPDGVTAAELADRIHRDPDTVRRLLDDLAELGYVELADEKGLDEPRAWLTAEGADFVNMTEDALLAASAQKGSSEPAGPLP